MKKINDFLNSFPMIIISGLFLGVSLLEHIGILGNFNFFIDPAWMSILISGLPLAWVAIERVVKNFNISSALLITIAMIACISIGEIFAAGEVAFIMAIGGWLEDRTVDRTKKGITQLLKLVPTKGRRINYKLDGTIKEEIVDPEELQVDDIIRVLPGETIPADGIIEFGQTSIDQSVMTGESLPVDKIKGDNVYTGTINCFGSIDIKVSKSFSDSSLNKMISLVKQAEDNKAPMQRTVDKFSAWFVPTACVIAIITYFVTKDITRAVTVLVVFCPCALALATPTSIVAAIGQATKFGVLIKSGEALERMGQINVVAFDKTGTLTHGNLAVSDVIPINVSVNELLKSVGSAEIRSEHPIGKAIVSFAKEKKIDLLDTEEFSMVVGKGVISKIQDKRVLCGNEKLMSEECVNISEKLNSVISELRGQGKAIVITAIQGSVIGIIALSDTIKENANSMIDKLLQSGISDTILLTGDNKKAAEYIGNKVGIKEIKSSLLPEDKVSEIANIQNRGQLICMVGDGVNDAPALKTATVGVAMGTIGSDIAIEAADIAIMGDDISKIGYIKRLSNATLKTIKFNIIAAMVINIVAIILSVMGLLNPVTGALVHNVGSVLVVLNAALLYDRKYIQ
ncbi:copper-translocating P-type ATPase [[Clostridium] bifermentans ATCC 638]|uniref:Cd(2+)-exporting ATPase n=1 Tax=Paraclostridium bifermentans ATCC 638 = DSM 14991 TaxID=1233171 RepID=T4VQ34_PARBF|nr:cation-translocating P-type ATPase [Paraclostridium bifermentans]EQK42871.1 copper-translocating P-type ATPase [[Clostridium] bifermentans ATCC 638] [Paraclostridium bifermentans ATCC 638 = DSM 14991]RIZ58003.1 copper-translocating P-type ATPase [Paraclostridium bifermentans]UAG16757.1 cation-translocating P-type ATPase [Paraclostridium bifermentans]